MAERSVARDVRIAGQPFRIRSRDVVRALRYTEPEPIQSHFVVVDSRRFPPKQVISAVTGLDRADFTTHQARRTLMGLGFAAGRRPQRRVRRAGALRTAKAREELSGQLQQLAGKWVALNGHDVLYAADSPQKVVSWLAQHGQQADSMFRVPEDELAATGLAPL
jgi:hypothetical protein